MSLITEHSNKIKSLCEQYHVRSLFAFGSVIKESFRPDSDIDLIVDINNTDPISYSDDYFGLKFQLEHLFQRQVDLLEQKAVKNRFLREAIEKNKVLVYGEEY
jgi:predicted nucleotidyltransferase